MLRCAVHPHLSVCSIPQHYWPRLLITCGGWIANDFAFYGVSMSRRLEGLASAALIGLAQVHALRTCDIQSPF